MFAALQTLLLLLLPTRRQGATASAAATTARVALVSRSVAKQSVCSHTRNIKQHTRVYLSLVKMLRILIFQYFMFF